MDDYFKFITRKDYKEFFYNLKNLNNWTYTDIEKYIGLHSTLYTRYLRGYKISRKSFIKLKRALHKLNLIGTLLT